MREILFRGKMKTDNGEYKKGDWVFGDLVRLKDGEKIYTMIYGIGEVDPSTVGQYTGMTDKNGKKIFEGDIVQSTKTKETAVVQWFSEHSAFMVWCKSSNEIGFLYECTKIIEIIGNIHDNPELLKGGAE